ETAERFDARVAGGLAARDSVASEDDRTFRLLDELERTLDDRLLRLRIRGTPDLEGLHVDGLAGDVLGKLDVRGPRFLETREAEGLAYDLGRRLADADPRAPFRDRAKHADDVDVLMRFLVRALQTDLPGDRDERRAIDVRVGNPSDEVGRARAKRGEAHAGI